MAQFFQIKCPNCRGTFSLDAGLANGKIRCNVCACKIHFTRNLQEPVYYLDHGEARLTNLGEALDLLENVVSDHAEVFSADGQRWHSFRAVRQTLFHVQVLELPELRPDHLLTPTEPET